MGVVQVANYIFPLLTIPYVVRIIGPGKYGSINFAQAIVAYFVLVINYSFEYTASRDIAAAKGKKNEINDIFCSVISVKIFLFVISTIIFVLMIQTIDKLSGQVPLFVISYSMVIGIIFFPGWYFIGTGVMSRMAMFNLLLKIVFTGLIFLLIREQDDYLMMPLSVSISTILSAAVAFWYVLKTDGIKIKLMYWEDIRSSIINGAAIFISLIFVSIYSLTNIVLLGFFSTDEKVGYFAAASKIISIIVTVVVATTGKALYPVIAETYGDISRDEQKQFIQKNIILLSMLTVPISLVLFFFADWIIIILFGAQFVDSIIPLKIISVLPIVFGISTILVIQTMFILKMEKQFVIISFCGVILSVTLNTILIPLLSINGVAATWLLVEVFVTFLSAVTLHNRGYTIFDHTFLLQLQNTLPLVKKNVNAIFLKKRE